MKMRYVGSLLAGMMLWSGSAQTGQAGLIHRYSFTSDASDSVGGAHGSLEAGATLSGGAVVLNGSGAYVNLPPGLVSNQTVVTIEAWASFGTSGDWARLFDFGDQNASSLGRNYIFFTPHAGGAATRMAISDADPGYNNEDLINIAGVLDNLGQKHVVCVFDPDENLGVLYLDGVQAGINTTFEIPFSSVHNVYSWIGRSLYGGDAYLNAQITEFRIYDHALTATEVAVNFANGPDSAVGGPVQFIREPANQTVTEGDPAIFTALATGSAPISYQWYRDDLLVTGATNPSYTLPRTQLSDHNAAFHLVVANTISNVLYTATSSNATLTVLADVNPPLLLRALTLSSNVLQVRFNKLLQAQSVTNPANYSITYPGGTVLVTDAALDFSGSNVVLNTGLFENDILYTLTISGVRDASSNLNPIAPNTSTNFLADLRFTLGLARLRNRYSFETDATDSVGGAHGELRGDALVANGGLVLDGNQSYLNLPNNLVTGLTSITIEAWIIDRGSGSWARIYDFGNASAGEDFPIGTSSSGTQYMFLSARSGGGTLRGAYTITGGGAGEQIVEWPGTALTPNLLQHVVWTSDSAAHEARLYVDGVEVGRNTAVTLTPDLLGPTVNNWIGRAQFSADAFLKATLLEFRMYDGSVGPAEVAASLAYGPDQLPSLGPAVILRQPTSLTAIELRPATFVVEVGGFPLPQVQWFRGPAPISGATNTHYTIPAVQLSDDQAVFHVVVSNLFNETVYTVTSSNAVLTVLPDTEPPLLVGATVASISALGALDGVLVQYSEGVSPETATNTANYTLTGPGGNVAILSGTLTSDGASVLLATALLTEGATYTVTVSGVRDASTAGNLIAPNSQAVFVARSFTAGDVGDPGLGNSIVAVPGGYDVTGSGAGSSGSVDQLGFSHQVRVGDFDVQVRVASIDLADGYAIAGLMARATLDPNSAYAAAQVSSGLGGCSFQYRPGPGLDAAGVGFFPVNYPYTWLRLQRVGNSVTGYAGFDGQTWVALGSASILMPDTVFLGFSISSHDPAAPVTGQFRDGTNVGEGTVVDSLSLPYEPLGPSSRATALTISEIMYHPPDFPGVTGSLEYVEIFNSQDYFEDLSGFQLDGDIHYTFPDGTTLPSGGFLVVARDPAAVQSHYGIGGVLGPWRLQTNITATATNVTGENLPNDQGTVRLENELGAHLLEVNYDSLGDWPAAADGAGHSLVLARPSYGEADVRAWAASEFIGGSPGRGESVFLEPQRAVVINEFLAHTDPPDEDALELFNTSLEPVDIGGCWLSDDFGTNKFRIPNGTVLPPRGFRSWTASQLGFALSSDGEEIFLVNSNRNRVLDGIRYGGQENGVSHGRYPDGGPVFSDLAAPTLGTNNAPPLRRDIVINEIMYRPISGNDDDEYVELHNRGLGPVSVGNWRFVDGIDFAIPGGVTIPAGGFLVVAKNRTNLLARYPDLAANPNRVVGDYGGQLANGGERVAVAMPDYNIQTNGTLLLTNVFYIVVNEVTYGDGGRWGQWSDGGGSSLELIDPRADNRLAPSWADSDETAKAPWTLVERTAPIDLGMTLGNGTPNRFEFFIEGPGECLMDEVECLNNGGPNRITNPGFESGTDGWAFQGTHARCDVQNGGAFAGNACLHVRAVERGDAGPNRVRTAIATMSTGGANQATLRARVRWLRGDTNILLRIRGQWMECAGGMILPTNLGTPGAPNSQFAANGGPAIRDVVHAPILPAANQPVVVTARVDDPDGVADVTLRYRLDPDDSLTDVAMRDDGEAEDAVAGDGIYSGTILGQAAGTFVAFHLQASDAHGSPASTLFPNDAPARECHVRFGETLRPGTIANYRMWVTQSNLTYWAARERNSNEGLDATFVYGNWRVIYNAQTLYSGSPFHTPTYNGPLGAVCDYELEVPKDDRFLGATEFVLNGQDSVYSFFNNDVSAQAETTAYWLGRKLGLGFNHKRHVILYLNGQQRGMIVFDHQQPNSQIVEEYFPNDPDGRLQKIEDWFEFDDSGGGFDYITSTMQNFVVGGQKRTERYRWNWRPRAGTHPNDFADLFALVDAGNAASPEPLTSATLGLVDMSTWMRVFAFQHTVGNWDSYGYRRGKNMYAYKPTQGPWKTMLWDLDLVLGKDSDGPTQDLFDTSGADGDPVIARWYQHPPFVREFWCALQELVDGPMLPEVYSPLVDARYAAFQANGLPVDSPAEMKSWIAQRVDYILTQIPNAAFLVNGPDTLTTNNNYITLTGTAPVTAKDILVNGAAYPLTWTSVTAWSLRIPLGPGMNTLSVTALDRDGNSLGERTITAEYTGTAPNPEDHVVINEIMYNPAVSQTSFVELFNTHPNYTFDLSGWRINGLSYRFPLGSVLPPGSYLVLGKNRGELAKVYGATTPVFDEFDGALQNNGETLTLLRPGPAPETELEVDKVKYEARAPWPADASQEGASLQLIDVAQDNARVSNWDVEGDWRFISYPGIPNGTRILIYPDVAGNLLIDDLRLVPGSLPGVGTNYIVNGNFEAPFGLPWRIQGTGGTGTTNNYLAAKSGSSSLELRFTTAGSGANYIYQDLVGMTASQTHTLSFWYLPSSNINNLTIRLSSVFRPVFGVRASTEAKVAASPGAKNNMGTGLPPYPLVWLNEVLPLNATGLTDNQSQTEPWIELYNSGSNTVFLEGFSLSDNYLDLTQWTFPPGAEIQPHQFKVIFADGQAEQTTDQEWHTSFRLTSGTGSVALSRQVEGSPLILDYLNYDNLAADRSYGSYPDGQLFDRQVFYYPTPGESNNPASPPLRVFINEWMAANTGLILDPADGNTDDWFELYNPGPASADLEGFHLTDDLADPFQFRIPAGYVIPPEGFLLVWADNDPGQNAPDNPDLHVNFALRQSGEAIGLFAADGTPIDAITYGPQTNNISEGRYPDGEAVRVFMTIPTPKAPNINPQAPTEPEIQSIQWLGNGQVSIGFTTQVGPFYQAEYKDDLNEPLWHPLGPAYLGTGGTIVIVDNTDSPQRFYQVSVLP